MDSDVVRRLHEARAAHGRPPEPVPESDPWDEPDTLDTIGAVFVVYPGTPRLRVTLHEDGEDAVQLDTYVTFDVPRRHTVAVVTALLSGIGVFVREPQGVMAAVSRRLRLEFSEEVAVDVSGTLYSQTVPWIPVSPLKAWVASLPRKP